MSRNKEYIIMEFGLYPIQNHANVKFILNYLEFMDF